MFKFRNISTKLKKIWYVQHMNKKAIFELVELNHS